MNETLNSANSIESDSLSINEPGSSSQTSVIYEEDLNFAVEPNTSIKPVIDEVSSNLGISFASPTLPAYSGIVQGFLKGEITDDSERRSFELIFREETIRFLE